MLGKLLTGGPYSRRDNGTVFVDRVKPVPGNPNLQDPRNRF